MIGPRYRWSDCAGEMGEITFEVVDATSKHDRRRGGPPRVGGFDD